MFSLPGSPDPENMQAEVHEPLSKFLATLHPSIRLNIASRSIAARATCGVPGALFTLGVTAKRGFEAVVSPAFRKRLLTHAAAGEQFATNL
jgi:hypothetical protein